MGVVVVGVGWSIPQPEFSGTKNPSRWLVGGWSGLVRLKGEETGSDSSLAEAGVTRGDGGHTCGRGLCALWARGGNGARTGALPLLRPAVPKPCSVPQ